MTYAPAEPGGTESHESATRTAIAKALAALKDYEFGGEYDARTSYGGAVYFVPADTLVGIEAARSLGIRGEQDLYGGVVPFAFVATKTISHSLVAPGARSPTGWSHAFAERVHDVVLPGFSAFSREDARGAGRLLLENGAVRLKPAQGIGGRDQVIVNDLPQLDACLEGMKEETLSEGLVVEQDLSEATTFSVGRVSVAGIVATYCGTQQMTTDNSGESVYGGSDLLVVRGDFDALGKLRLTSEARHAVAQARLYDAATEEFPGMFASRRNYDMVRGRDGRGHWRSGVLEQSWRIGGASGPEVAALAAFRADPALAAVHARSTEAYGERVSVPAGALVHFSGRDSRLGPLTKYTLVERHDPAR